MHLEEKPIQVGMASIFSRTAAASGGSKPMVSAQSAGPSYTLGGHTAAFDYKRIAWSDATGYKDFGWEDQDVFMVGYQFTSDLRQLRAGYNYAKSPIKELDWMSNGGAALNMFNLLGFPATVEQHFTLGGTHNLNETLACDLVFAYAPETGERFTSANLSGPYEIGSKQSQTSVSLQVAYTFDPPPPLRARGAPHLRQRGLLDKGDHLLRGHLAGFEQGGGGSLIVVQAHEVIAPELLGVEFDEPAAQVRLLAHEPALPLEENFLRPVGKGA